MITFYENNPQNQMGYQQRKPDELSFLSDDEDDINIGFNKNKPMSQSTANDSAYYSESSNQATTLISPSKDSPSPTTHQNVILWQKQQQQYQKSNINPSHSFNNNNDINPLDSIPHIDEWNSPSDNSPNNSQYPSPGDPTELSYNSPEQRTQRIQLRMSQWKEKVEMMSGSSAISSSSSTVGGYGRSCPSPNSFLNRRARGSRHQSFSSSIDLDNNVDRPFSPFRSSYSVSSLSNSVFDEKYDSFVDDDRESVFSLRNSNFNSNIPPRSKSSMEVRNPRRGSRIYGSSVGQTSPLKESKIHIMQAELENSQRIYKQKLQQINQMKQDLEEYQYKLEEIREKEIEQVRQETIEELEATVIKNLNLEIEALQNKLQETTTELEHSKAYSDMLRNELITLKMNEQAFREDDDDVDFTEENSRKISFTINNGISRSKSNSTVDLQQEQELNEQKERPLKSSELERLEMLERELKKKNEEIIELKKKLDKSTKLNELSKREIALLNKKVENHRQAREDIEQRHTKLVDVASANEIELNKLRYKLSKMSKRQNKAIKKMQRRYSSILEEEEEEGEEIREEEEEIITVENDDQNNTLNENETKTRNPKIKSLIHEEENEDNLSETLVVNNKMEESEDKSQNDNNSSNVENSNSIDQTSIHLDDTINDIIDLSQLDENDILSDSSNLNSDNLDDLLNELEISDLDIEADDDDDNDDIDLNALSFEDETVLV